LKKLFVISEYISLKENTTSYYWARLTDSLQNIYDTEIVCPKNKFTKTFINESSLKCHFIHDLNLSKNNIFTRIIRQLLFSLQIFFIILGKADRNSVILTGTNPSLNLYVLTFLKMFKGFKFLLVCHDVFPLNLKPSGLIKSKLLLEILKYISRPIYRSCDFIFVIGRDMKDAVISTGANKNKISYIPNWANASHVFPQEKEKNKLIIKENLKENIVFTFFGNIGRLQGVENIISAMEFVKDNRIKLLIIGDGALKEKIKNDLNKGIYKNIIYYGPLKTSLQNIGLNACDVALVSLIEGMKGLAVPSKSYFSLAADKPILYIGEENSEIDLIIKEHQLGWQVQPNNPKKLALLMDSIARDWPSNRPKNIYEKQKESFSEEQALRSYLNHIKDFAK